MGTFLKLLVGGVVALIVITVVSGAILPTPTPAERLASDRQLCERQAGIQLNTIADVSAYPSSVQNAEIMDRLPKVAAYARCMQTLGYSMAR